MATIPKLPLSSLSAQGADNTAAAATPRSLEQSAVAGEPLLALASATPPPTPPRPLGVRSATETWSQQRLVGFGDGSRSSNVIASAGNRRGSCDTSSLTPVSRDCGSSDDDDQSRDERQSDAEEAAGDVAATQVAMRRNVAAPAFVPPRPPRAPTLTSYGVPDAQLLAEIAALPPLPPPLLPVPRRVTGA